MKTGKTIIATALAALVAGGATAGELRYATSQPTVHAVYSNAVQPFIERLSETTGGELTVRPYPGGQLASARGALAALGDGTADASMVVPLWTPSEIRSIYALSQLLFTGDDILAISGATVETTLLDCPECADQMGENGAMSMAPYSTTPYYMMCNQEIASAEEFAGKRIRIAGGVQANLLTELGASRVNMPPAELSEALARGQVDCAIASLPFLVSYSLIDSVKYIIDYPLGHFRGVEIFALRKDSWDGLTDTERAAVIENSPMLVADSVFKGNIAEDDEARSLAESRGITIAQPDEGFVAIVDTVRAGEKAFLSAQMEERGVPDFDSLYERHGKLIEKWTGLVEGVDTPEDFAKLLWDEVYSKL